MAKAAMLSGGKDSLYAAYLEWPIDYGVVLVYDFPRPSPHLVNLGKTVETLLLTGVRVVVAKLTRGREKEETASLLQRLGVNTLVAGDVYVEDHLRYMEEVAGLAGASLREPLWGRDPEELLYREVSTGFRPLITGTDRRLGCWLGRIIDSESVDYFAEYARSQGADVLGEKGEYHTLVLESPLHEKPLAYSGTKTEVYGDYLVLRVW